MTVKLAGILESFNRFAAQTVAADGTATIAIGTIVPSQYAAMLASFQASGNPIWTLTVGGRPVGFGVGPNVDIGPRLVAPGEQVALSIVGGLPGTLITGQCHGGRADTIDEVILYASLLGANTQSLLTSNPRKLLYPDGATTQTGPSFQVPAAVNTNATFTLPSATTDIRISSVVQGGLTTTFTTAIFVVGVQTGVRYFPKAGTGQPFGSRQPISIPVDSEQDRQVQVQVSPDGTHALDVYVSALFAVEAVEVYAQEPIPVTLGQFAVGGSIPVPAPAWQVFGHVGPTAGPLSVASPSPGLSRALMYEVVFSVAANAAGRIFQGRVWDGASGGTQIGGVTLGGSAPGGSTTEALHRLVGSAGNVLTFDFDFATMAAEAQTITASGDFVQ